MNFQTLPWHAIRETFFLVRRAGFGKSAPETSGVIVSNHAHETVPLKTRIERLFGRRYFEPNEFSYYYFGETINLRRAFRDDDLVDGLRWFQDHIRGFDDPAGLRLICHREPEPLAHPKAHLSDDHVDWQTGHEQLKAILDVAGEPYYDPTTDDTPSHD